MIIILVITLICMIVNALTALAIEESKAGVENYENNIDEVGNYNFSFKTSNGIIRSEEGTVVDPGSTDEHITVQGKYSYVDPDGKLVIVRYYANDTGFHVLSPLPSIPTTVFPPIIAISGGVGPNVVATLLGR